MTVKISGTALSRWLLPSALALTGCNSCEPDAPYTPFTVGSASAEPVAQAAASVAPPVESSAPLEPPSFVGKAAIKAPSGLSKWKLGGQEVNAPEGQVFEQALEADLDGDDKADVVTWSVAKEPGSGPAGTLWFHPAVGKARALSDLPAFIPTGPACKLSTKLDQTGPKSLTLITRAACTTHLIPRSPVGALTVISPTSKEPKLLELRLADVVAGERRQIQIDSADRDSDGLDDVALKLRLERGDASATLSFSWYQRAQGTARDDSEPRKSLEALSYTALANAKKQGLKALPQIQAAQRVWANVCAEAGTPRLFDTEGSPIKCRAESALARINEAEAQALLTDKQPAAALALLERDGWLGRFDSKTLAALDGAARAQLDQKQVKLSRLSVKALGRGPEPRLSPLDFEPSGALLVQTTGGVQRVAADGEPSDASEEVDAWPIALKTDAGLISRVTTPCDSAEVQLTTAGGKPLLTGLLSPRPGVCGAGAAVPELRLTVFSADGSGVEGRLGGAPIGKAKSRAEAVMRPHQAGTARSPDGKFEVLAIKAGLVVLGGPSDSKPQLWTATGLETGGLGDCVVASGAAAVACVEESGAVVRLAP